jgi:hypothetical protein
MTITSPFTFETPALPQPLGLTWLGNGVAAAWSSSKSVATLPFDAMRAFHANAVRAGWIRSSMLEARDFEHAVDALERAALGPLARRV